MPEEKLPNQEQGQYYAVRSPNFLRGSGKPGSTALLLLGGEVLQGHEHLLDSDRQLGIAGCGIIDLDSSRGNPLASKTSKVQAANMILRKRFAATCHA
jgi:hypothetical protein